MLMLCRVLHWWVFQSCNFPHEDCTVWTLFANRNGVSLLFILLIIYNMNIRGYYKFHVKWVPCFRGMARPQVADSADGLQIVWATELLSGFLEVRIKFWNTVQMSFGVEKRRSLAVLVMKTNHTARCITTGVQAMHFYSHIILQIARMPTITEYIHTGHPNTAVGRLTLLIRMRYVFGSIFGLEIGYSDSIFWCTTSLHTGKHWHIALE
jgi:hypothetical protein